MASSFSSEDFDINSSSLIAVSKKSIAELNQPQTEKPLHYTYLKEFRVEQCQLFQQHKCIQHRPFTCFSWHFLNQKRRRPKKKKDGTFTYSPDVYCQDYNETTGECVNEEDCPYLHRVAGDVERRYHLRYYKTSPCVYETDARGYCVKNGPHCAFAHGPHDLRQPVYDVRELQIMEQEENEGDHSKQIVPEDPRWNESTYVLGNYKTEPCKKPPRLCRQGYACPQYHNNRDRRRSPHKYKYRSTPCPNVKHGDEWGDPCSCENGDSCSYCHTRTEQQFHPEIYKSTKCNDMEQTNQCPRSCFCAFAHIEQDQMPSSLDPNKHSAISIVADKDMLHSPQPYMDRTSVSNSPLPSPAGMGMRGGRSSSLCGGAYAKIVEGTISSLNDTSLSSSVPAYEKAPGSGRRSNSKDSSDRAFFGPHHGEPRTPSRAMSVQAPTFYPGPNADESALDSALLDAISNVDNTFEFDFPDNASVGSSIGGGGSQSGGGLNAGSILGQFGNNGSDPVSIPGKDLHRTSFNSQQSHSPTSPGMGANSSYYINQSGGSRAASSGGNGGGGSFIKSPKSTPLGLMEMMQSPKFNSPNLTSPLALGSLGKQGVDIQRLTDEIISLRTKLATWEDSWNQAKQACNAWQQEVSNHAEKAKQADRDRVQALIKLGEAESEIRSLQQELKNVSGGGTTIHLLKNVTDVEKLPIVELKQLFGQLKMDAEGLEKIISRRESMKCIICENEPRCVVTYPCSHCVMCEGCAKDQTECPFCKQPITQKATIFIPV